MIIICIFLYVFQVGYKEGSVHKLLILAAVPEIQELHQNLKILIDELNLASLKYSLSSDIKMGE